MEREKKSRPGPAWGVTLFSGAVFFAALGAWPVGIAMAAGGAAYLARGKKRGREDDKRD